MRLVPYDDVAASEWNRVCDACDDAWLFHRYEWIQLEMCRLTASNHSFGIMAKDQLIGIVPLFQSAFPIGPFTESLLHTGIHRHTGIAIAESLNPVQKAEVESLALKACLKTAVELEVDRLQLNVQNAAPRWRPGGVVSLPFWASSENVHFGMYSGPNGIVPIPFMSTLAVDLFYDLSVSPEIPGLGVSSSARTAARKAFTNGLRATWVTPVNQVGMILDIAEKSSRRSGEAMPNIAYFTRLLNNASFEPYIHILVVRDKSNREVGVLVLAELKGVVHFLHGFSDPEYINLRINDYMHSEAIKWARDQTFSFYRLGPYFPEVPRDWPISQTSWFKKKYANSSVPVRQGSIFLKRDKYMKLAQHTVTDWR